jgi:hypothetical protein
MRLVVVVAAMELLAQPEGPAGHPALVEMAVAIAQTPRLAPQILVLAAAAAATMALPEH